ncbi:uncharacterized protein F4812DRAFT_65970 [Daldinia caldariorum]|uniref:uncharacterized protein n=1 Tax=Daldinia caldariorum TaxID=326644 RepID=UPI0020081BB3|nr:uncharacterized protein F4812DRAFT_65970 [Daldinia caldariorum]KAI1466787.1 hypothetical protein F4812DRAFT_65970 [Daldinia caldariorum]
MEVRANIDEDLIPPPTTINNTHKVYRIAIVCIVLGVISSAAVVARLGQRWRTKALGAEDYAMVPAIMLFIGWTSLAAYMNLQAGVGKPLMEITVAEYEIWFQGIITSAWLYPLMSAAIRISIVLFYLKMFGTRGNRYTRYFLWTLLACQGLYVVVFSILPAFICSPVYYFWRPMERYLHCSDWYYYYTQVALFSVSMVFDIVLLVFPVFPVWKLQMPLRKRVGVATILMLGAGASIAAAYKLAVFVLQMERYVPTDPTWLKYSMSRFIPAQFDEYGVTFWIPTQVEPTVALIGTSIPALYQLAQKAVPRLRSFITSRFSVTNSSSGISYTPKQRQPQGGNFHRMSDSQVGLQDHSQDQSIELSLRQ